MITRDQVINVLKQCYDPEVHIDIYTMGLIYDIKIDKNNINIKMTLTTPTCPYGPQLIEEIKSKLKEIKEIKDVKIDIVFQPPWKPSKELRAVLGLS